MSESEGIPTDSNSEEVSSTEDVAATSRDQRRLANKLINPREQISMGVRMISIGTGAAALGLWIAYRTLIADLDAMLRMGLMRQDGYDALKASVNWSMGYIGMDMLLIFTLIVLFGIWVSHRIFGPIIPIRRHIRALIDGDYRGSLRLRKDDAFQDVASDLNELARTLEGKPDPSKK